MHDGSILDLGLNPQFAPRTAGQAMPGVMRRMGALALVPLCAGAFALGSFGIAPALQAVGLYQPSGEAVLRLPLDELRKVQDMTVDDKSQIVTEGEDARTRNAAIPMTSLALEHVRGFRIQDSAAAAKATALKCLTQAVYYEAAFEPLQGRRAVAQVVLNRMRHPAYPNSVCGVVYQGAERQTGCQFSFTCDGALLRKPSAAAWHEAEKVAKAALAGHVEPSVGTATHYHADYVLPKWAFRLGKITQLGSHIFYRFNGSWGRSSAFQGRYSGIEWLPEIDFAALRQRADALAQGFTPGLTVTPHVTDRHAEADVGGRLDVTKQWRLTIPDPASASSRYRDAVTETSQTEKAPSHIALARVAPPIADQ